MTLRDQRGLPRLTLGHVRVILLVLAVVAVLPSTVASILHDARSEDAEVIYLPDLATYQRAAIRLHLEITGLTEAAGSLPSRCDRSGSATPAARCASASSTSP
jgi:hypothetical protein